MSDKKMLKLLNTILNKAEQSLIKWEVTSKKNTFQVSFPQYSVITSKYPAADPDEEGDDYFLAVYNSEGVEVEKVSDVDLREIDENSYEKMKGLYDSARGYALGSDKALDNIIKNISKLNPDDIPF